MFVVLIKREVLAGYGEAGALMWFSEMTTGTAYGRQY